MKKNITIIVGDAGTGKNKAALDIIANRNALTISCGDFLQKNFAALNKGIEVLVIDECYFDKKSIVEFKALMTAENLIVHRKGYIPEMIERPEIIILSNDTGDDFRKWLHIPENIKIEELLPSPLKLGRAELYLHDGKSPIDAIGKKNKYGKHKF